MQTDTSATYMDMLAEQEKYRIMVGQWTTNHKEQQPDTENHLITFAIAMVT